MFKSKKNRDTALLFFMALILILFILYMIFPPGENESKKMNIADLPVKDKVKKINSGPGEIVNASDISEPLREELNNIFNNISSGKTEINIFPVSGISSILAGLRMDKEGCSMEKLLRYSFRDIWQITTADCGEEINNSERFDIYTALFLNRLNKDNIFDRLFNSTTNEINRFINLTPYDLINNEIVEDYQLLPVMVYSTLIIRSLDIFGDPESGNNLLLALNKIKDLTKSQYLNSIKDILSSSRGIKKYTISWTEYDPIDPDDKGMFKNVVTDTNTFFKYNFFTFPDNTRPASNIWINELADADNGSIELRELKIVEETPGERLTARSIFYSPNISRFIVIMDSPAPLLKGKYILKLYREKTDEILRNYISINFSEKISDEKKFRKKLLKFGKYLYRNRSIFKTSNRP
ncbi:MAG: hypothetical protein ABFR75_04785 [Acidobacteriota bacterium]